MNELYRETKDVDGVKTTTIYYDNGDVYSESEVGEPFRTYFELSDVIWRNKDISSKLAACEESYKILGEFVRVWMKDSDKLPDTIACRDVGVELYLRLGEWEKARVAIAKIAAAGAYTDGGVAAVNHYEKYRHAAESALEFLRTNAGFLQRDIYKALPDIDRECLKSFIRSSSLIRKEKFGKTNRLYVRG